MCSPFAIAVAPLSVISLQLHETAASGCQYQKLNSSQILKKHICKSNLYRKREYLKTQQFNINKQACVADFPSEWAPDVKIYHARQTAQHLAQRSGALRQQAVTTAEPIQRLSLQSSCAFYHWLV